MRCDEELGRSWPEEEEDGGEAGSWMSKVEMCGALCAFSRSAMIVEEYGRSSKSKKTNPGKGKEGTR